MAEVSAIGNNLPLPEIPAAKASVESTNSDFSSVFADTLQNMLTLETLNLTGGTGTNDSLSYLGQGSGIEAMLTQAASSGGVDDLQTAMLMLCMMMQSGSGSGFSPIMDVMVTLLGNLYGEDKENLYDNIMSSGYDAFTLSGIDSGVFGTKSATMPTLTGTDSADIPVQAWRPTTPAVINNEQNRSAGTLRAVIDQFNVETEARYSPYRDGNTYCNIFLWDVTSAMGCEIPHYVDKVSGAPRSYPDISGAYELDAAGIENWLVEYGSEYGWREASAVEAQNYANAGKVAVTTAGNIGHVQVVCPSENGGYDPIRGVSVAQAGARVYNYTYLSNIYSASSQGKIRYFVHE